MKNLVEVLFKSTNKLTISLKGISAEGNLAVILAYTVIIAVIVIWAI